MMPPQLARAKRPKRSEPRPIVELTPHLDIHELRHIIPRNYSTYIYRNDFKYPFAQKITLSRINIEVLLHSGYNQHIGLHWVRTGMGRSRAIFVCQCGYGARRLFFRHGYLACKVCHQAQYLCQKQKTSSRKRLTASKLRLKLGRLPNINEPLPAKAKGKHRKRYQRLRNQVIALEAQAKLTRFRKDINIRALAYHVP